MSATITSRTYFCVTKGSGDLKVTFYEGYDRETAERIYTEERSESSRFSPVHIKRVCVPDGLVTLVREEPLGSQSTAWIYIPELDVYGTTRVAWDNCRPTFYGDVVLDDGRILPRESIA